MGWPVYLRLAFAEIILWMRPANKRRGYFVTSSLIGWAHSQNDPCIWGVHNVLQYIYKRANSQ